MDLAMEAAGAFGKLQKVITVLVLAMGTLPLLLSVSYPFLTKQPEFLCREKGNIFDNFLPCHEENLCHPDLFEYKKNEETSILNISYDFDLTCDRKSYVNLIGTSFFFGGIFGSVVLSPIPDNYGRAGIYKILVFSNFIIHLNLFISNSTIHLVVVNTIAGFVSYVMSMCTLMITEYIHRSQAGMLMTIHSSIFPTSGVCCALFFMYINNWRYLFLFTSFLSFIALYVAFKYLVESPRWLFSNNRVSESIEAFRKIAEINGNTKRFEIFIEKNPQVFNTGSNNENSNKSTKTYNLIEIFRLKSQKLSMYCLSYIWMASGFCFYGLILNLEHLGGNMFLNSIVTFCGEMFSELLSGVLAEEFGRLFVLKISGFIGGTSFILYELIDQKHWYRSIFIFLTSFGFSGTFNVIYIYTPEIFPTIIRSTAIGFLYLMSRLGALLVPSITPLIPHNPVLFGILSICTSYVSTYLTETLGKEIPDDVPESLQNSQMVSLLDSAGNRHKSSSFYHRTVVDDEYFKHHE